MATKRFRKELVNCIVPQCEGKSNNNIKLFRIPENCKKQWCKNLQIYSHDKRINSCARVCNRHFLPSCIGKNKLKPGSVPTLNLGHEDIDVKQPLLSTGKTREIKCSVPNCMNFSPIHRIFKFPEDTEKYNRWRILTQLMDECYNEKRLYICEKHFEKRMLGKKKLKKFAFPLLNLPMQDNHECQIQEVDEKDAMTGEVEEEVPSRTNCESCLNFGRVAEYYRKKCEEFEDKLNEQTNISLEIKKELDEWKTMCMKLTEYQIMPKCNADLFASSIIKTQRSVYTEEQRILFQQINYISSKCYNFMRKSLKFTLPSPQTLNRWVPVKMLQPGINDA